MNTKTIVRPCGEGQEAGLAINVDLVRIAIDPVVARGEEGRDADQIVRAQLHAMKLYIAGNLAQLRGDAESTQEFIHSKRNAGGIIAQPLLQRRIAGEVPEIPAQAAGDGIQPANIEHQRHAEHVALFHQPAVDLRRGDMAGQIAFGRVAALFAHVFHQIGDDSAERFQPLHAVSAHQLVLPGEKLVTHFKRQAHHPQEHVGGEQLREIAHEIAGIPIGQGI